MHTMTNPPMGNGWRKRLQDKAMKDASRNDPELLARRAESQARIEVERQEQNRLIAEDEARRASETVRFPDMSLAMACDMIEAYARYKVRVR